MKCSQPSISLFFIQIFLLIFFTTSIHAQTDNKPTSSTGPWNVAIGNKPRPQNARTIVDADGGAWFDDASNTIEYFGKVVVHDPQFTLFCDKLTVVMNKNRQGSKLITASGNVIIEQENRNEQGEVVKSSGRAGEAIYLPATGDITLKLWPQIQQGSNAQVATEEGTTMTLNGKGTLHTEGQSRTMIIDQGTTSKKESETK